MKAISIAAAAITLVLIALMLTPPAGDFRADLAIGALVGSIVALAAIVAGWRQAPSQSSVASLPGAPVTNSLGSTSKTSVAAVQNPAPPPPPVTIPPLPQTASAEAQIVAFLAALQDKGRLVDFLRDDITGYTDAQVGAAARVVHQGCKAALDEYLRIVPVRTENEGATVTVPAGYFADEYRLVGRISGEAPFAGTLTHRGWKAESVRVPRVLHAGDDRLPTIAPAEVELR